MTERGTKQVFVVRFLMATALIAVSFAVGGCPGGGSGGIQYSEFSRILIAMDGSLVLLGHSGYSSTKVNFFVLGPDGGVRVAKVLPTTNSWSVGAAALTANGEVLVGGTQVRPFVTLPSLIRRLTMEGEVVWGRTTSLSPDNVFGIYETAAEEILTVEGVSGTSTHFTAFDSDGTIIREGEDLSGVNRVSAIDHDGNIVGLGYGHINKYSGSFERLQSSELNFDEYEIEAPTSANDIIVTENGDIVFVGGAGGAGFATNFWIVRMTVDGVVLWLRDIEVSRYEAHAVVESDDGSLYVAGRNGLLKLDANGNEIWRTSFDAEIFDIAISSDRAVFAAGMRGVQEAGELVPRNVLMEFDADGSLLSDRNFEAATEE